MFHQTEQEEVIQLSLGSRAKFPLSLETVESQSIYKGQFRRVNCFCLESFFLPHFEQDKVRFRNFRQINTYVHLQYSLPLCKSITVHVLD